MKKRKFSLPAWIFIGMVAGVDKIFDMGRTALNITGDATCAIWISKLEQKKMAAKK